VQDIDATYTALVAAGVEFDMPPTKQPWGGTLALFKDPDGNIFYLDPGGHDH
jgi:lactoylglutathione lyase